MNLRNKSILVTGGAGFIGSHLVDKLIDMKPESLIVIDNFYRGSPENLSIAKRKYPKLKIVNQDITDYIAFNKLVGKGKFDVVFHMAVIPLPASLIKPEWAFRQNVSMSLNLCSLLRKKKFKTLIHCSSSEVYGSAVKEFMDEQHQIRPMTSYAASKAAADHLAISYYETFKLDVAIPRPFNIYGSRHNYKSYPNVVSSFIHNILKNKPPIIFGDGEQSRDFTYVEDCAEAILKIYISENTRGKIINIGNGKSTTINELARIISSLMNSKLKPIYKEQRPGDVRRHQADIRLAKKLINYQPKVSLIDGLKKQLNI